MRFADGSSVRCVTEEEESRRTTRFWLEQQWCHLLRWGALGAACPGGRANQEVNFA